MNWKWKAVVALLVSWVLLHTMFHTAFGQEIPRMPIIPDDGVVIIGVIRAWDGKVSMQCNAVNVDQKYDESQKVYRVLAVTATHCLRATDGVVGDFQGTYISHYTPSAINLVYIDAASIVYVSPVKVHTYEQARELPVPGSWIAVVSHANWDANAPLYPTWHSYGVFIGPFTDSVHTFLRITSYGQPGFSGSPVFYNGEVLGIVSAGDTTCERCGSSLSAASGVMGTFRRVTEADIPKGDE